MKYTVINFIFIFIFSFCSSNGKQEKYHLILKTVYKTIHFLHPNPISINNDFSQKIYNKYFEKLDNKKRFFLQKDIEDFSLYKNKIDDFWTHGDPTFFNAVIKRFSQRVKKVESICFQLLRTPFNFNKEEILFIDSKDIDYPKNDIEWMEKWRKYLKYLTLLEIIDSIHQKKLNVLSKETWKNAFINEEATSRRKVEVYIQEYLRKLRIKKEFDWFSMYVNTITTQYDPHSNYLSPKDKEIFDFSISGQKEGIGIKLQEDKGYATVVQIIVGSPAWKSKKIEIGDKIIRVSRDIDSKSKNIVGMLLENSIRLIRGKKGSQVKLTIQKKNGSIEDVSLIRDIIEKKEIFARSAIILDKNKNKYGLIFLPEFYFNPENQKGRNSAQDMKKIIKELKKENIKGLILDIRNNGGGSLDTAIKITGFFLGKVPIVQIGSKNKKKILKNNDEKILWEGPLIVLVNEFSASASEILSAAISDYKRGIIVGSDQTYGKGTVQTVYPLNQFFLSNEELGSLKFTIHKFYRVNGSSTQLKGVNSDIVIPHDGNNNIYLKFMEKNQKNSMKWDSVDPVPYSYWDKKKIEKLEDVKIKSINRLSKKKGLITIYKTIQSLEKNFSKTKKLSLNWEKLYLQNRKTKIKKKISQKIKNYLNIYGSLIFPSSYEINQEKLESKEQKEWKKNLKKDFYISECVQILRNFNEIP